MTALTPPRGKKPLSGRLPLSGTHAPIALFSFLTSLLLLGGCTEKTTVAMTVMRDRAESRLLVLAGEGEVAVELYRQQYADLKERLVRLKTILSQHRDSLEQAYASDDARRIKLYSDLVA
jgi:hypothetical protein